MDQALSIIILCAGKGTRMKSSLPKVMHKIAGRRMIDMVIDEAIKLDPKNITLVYGTYFYVKHLRQCILH